MLKCQKAKGSNQNVKCPENVGKGQKKGGGATLKIKKYTILNVDYFEIGGGGAQVSGFSHIQMTVIWTWF